MRRIVLFVSVVVVAMGLTAAAVEAASSNRAPRVVRVNEVSASTILPNILIKHCNPNPGSLTALTSTVRCVNGALTRLGAFVNHFYACAHVIPVSQFSNYTLTDGTGGTPFPTGTALDTSTATMVKNHHGLYFLYWNSANKGCGVTKK
jgi:hypothetical protein